MIAEMIRSRKAPLIFVPTPEIELFVELPPILFEGHITWELIDARTQKVIRSGGMRNMIMNSGLDSLGLAPGGITTSDGTAPASSSTYIQVGTSAVAPAVDQTSLFAPVGARVGRLTPPNNVDGNNSAGGYNWWRRVYLFVEAEANGNLAEVGLFYTTAGTPMWMRQLFKDNAGVNTVVTKTSNEQLKITYELRMYPPTADVVQTLGGYTITVRTRGRWDSRYWGGFVTNGYGPIYGFGNFTRLNEYLESDVLAAADSTAWPGGNFGYGANNTLTGYVNGTFYRDCQSIVQPASFNWPTGIGQVYMWNPHGANQGHSFQVKFAPKIPKGSTQRLTIGHRVSWGRYP